MLLTRVRYFVMRVTRESERQYTTRNIAKLYTMRFRKCCKYRDIRLRANARVIQDLVFAQGNAAERGYFAPRHKREKKYQIYAPGKCI